MNKELEKRLFDAYQSKKEKNELNKLIFENISFDSIHTPVHVFEVFDQFFMPYKDLDIIDVNINDINSIKDFCVFYTSIYLPEFPDPNERESFDSFLKYLENNEICDKYDYHIILAKDTATNEIIGGAIFDYFSECNSGIIEFICVSKKYQSQGVGKKIYENVKRIIVEDALKYGKKLDSICIELDKPEYHTDEKKYLYFWNSNAYKRLDFDYVQPALSENQGSVNNLYFAIVSMLEPYNTINKDKLLKILYCYYKYSMSIEDPSLNKEFIKIKQSLSEKKEIKLINLL